MIAAGLCMLGGCFAQDESGRVVDTYWAAEKVKIETDVENIIIADVVMLGGDFIHDELRISYQVDDFGNSFAIAGMRPAEGREGMLLFQGYNQFCVLGGKSGNSREWKEALRERVDWWSCNGVYKRGDEVGELEEYTLSDSEIRYFRVGSALVSQNRYIFNVMYLNRRTGVKSQWQPMVGMYGAAFYEPVTSTLAEQ